MQPPPENDQESFRKVIWAVLLIFALFALVMDWRDASGGWLLPFAASLALGASFFGRRFAVIGAILSLLAVHTNIAMGLGIAAVVLLIGERTQHLRSRLARFAARSFTDRLTGLFNFAFLQAQVRHEVDRVRRYGGSCSLIVLDLDHFKKFNDTHGHQAGNLLLQAISETIRNEKRESDFAARFGGEEFVVLVPGDGTEAMRFAERLRIAVANIELPQLGPDGHVSGSLGIASFPAQATSAAELFEHADQALYVAKGTGRDRVVVYPNSVVRRKAS